MVPVESARILIWYGGAGEFVTEHHLSKKPVPGSATKMTHTRPTTDESSGESLSRTIASRDAPLPCSISGVAWELAGVWRADCSVIRPVPFDGGIARFQSQVMLQLASVLACW